MKDTVKTLNSVGQLLSAAAETILTYRRHESNQEKLASALWKKFVESMNYISLIFSDFIIYKNLNCQIFIPTIK